MRDNTEEIGFVGLGVMGRPMALNLVKAGNRLIVWNRSFEPRKALRDAGAIAVDSVDDVFGRTRVVIFMLVNEAALDEVLKRSTSEFGGLVKGHVIVSMGSNSPEYSRALAHEIAAAGGRYVEAPVSGSRKPAESGQLVSLVGGDADTVAEICPLLSTMCREIVRCGPVGNALLMKLAVNLYLNAMLAAMAEAVHFADRCGLDLATFKSAIDSGPMNCDFTRMKLSKLITRDFSVQAATEDALNSTRLIADAARGAGIATPLLDLASDLYGESVALGNAREDMISVLRSSEARTLALTGPNLPFGIA
jgi:3-hydroxyisobutyrate dehydrogenase